MKYLFFLKRFELWLLFGIVVALLIFAFQPVDDSIHSVPRDDTPEVPSAMSTEKAEEIEEGIPKQMTVRKVTVEPGASGQIVEVTLLARSQSNQPVPLNETTLRATTSEGVLIPHFFSPFQPEQIVTDSEESLVTVKLWLAEATDTIWLDFLGERAQAKLPGES